MVLTFSACQKDSSPTAQKAETHPLMGQWATVSFPIEAQLQINRDSTFHVDLAVSEGIEIEGIADLNDSLQITFRNTAGSDSVASNPYPGTYRFELMGDTLHFTKVQDTISRRELLLSAAWIRSNTEKKQ